MLNQIMKEAKKMIRIKKNFNLKKFIMNQPFTKSGETHGSSLEDQWVEQTIFTCEKAFPYIRHRVKVKSKEVTTIEPTKNAMNLLQSKIDSLNKILVDTDQISANTLQLILQGALLTQVNAGPLAIGEVFCNKKYPKEVRTEIIALLKTLNELLEKAIEINAKIITEEQQKFHEAIVEGHKKFSSYVGSLGKRKRTKKELSRSRIALDPSTTIHRSGSVTFEKGSSGPDTKSKKRLEMMKRKSLDDKQRKKISKAFNDNSELEKFIDDEVL